MAAFRHLITVPLSIGAFVGVFYAIAKLMVFLSLPVKIPIQQVWIANLLDDWSKLETTLLPLTTDAILIVLFILPHSFLKSNFIKSIWNKIGLSTASRSFYNLITSATLLVRTHIILKLKSQTTLTIRFYVSAFDSKMGTRSIICIMECGYWIESNSLLGIFRGSFPCMAHHLRRQHCYGSTGIDRRETSMCTVYYA